MLPNIDVDSIDALHKLSRRDKGCIPMMGLHPCGVDLDYSTQLKRIRFELFQGSKKYIAVGELELICIGIVALSSSRKLLFEFK